MDERLKFLLLLNYVNANSQALAKFAALGVPWRELWSPSKIDAAATVFTEKQLARIREAEARADAAEGGAGGEDDGEVRAEKHGQVAQAVADAHREHGRAEREQRESRSVPGRLSRRSGLVISLVISLVIGLSIGLVSGLGRSGLSSRLVGALGGLCLTNRPTLH